MGWMGWMGAGSGTGIGLQRLATSRNVRGPRRIGAARRRRLQGRYPGIGFGAGSIWPTTAAAKQQTWKTHKRWKECIDATLRASCTAQTTGLPFPHPLHHIHPAGCQTGQNIRTEYTSSLLHRVYCARITVFYTDHYYCASAWAAGIERSMGSVREGRGAADGVLRGGCRQSPAPRRAITNCHFCFPFPRPFSIRSTARQQARAQDGITRPAAEHVAPHSLPPRANKPDAGEERCRMTRIRRTAYCAVKRQKSIRRTSRRSQPWFAAAECRVRPQRGLAEWNISVPGWGGG